MRPFTLGIDTSCYTTSIAVVDENGVLISENRMMLEVKKGARGLRQSEGFFQHVINLPVLFEEMCKDVDVSKIGCIAVSTRPRNQEDSYMPVFTAGEKFAKTLSLALNIPVFTTTHQDGHLMASAKAVGFDHTKPHVSVHLSGGTSEILRTNWASDGFEVEVIGGALDLSAGQLIDRVGVAMDVDFPCGQAMDQMLYDSKKDLYFPVSVKESWFNLCGSETYGLNYIKNNESYSDISKGLFNVLSKTITLCLESACGKMGVTEVLMAGGVSSSKYLRSDLKKRLAKKNIKAYFTTAKYAADNAIGVAWLGGLNRSDRGGKHEA